MKTAILFFIFFVTLKVNAQTHNWERIDMKYQKCINSDTSIGNIGTCAFSAISDWEKEMNKAFDGVLKSLKLSKDKIAFKHAQSAWLVFRDAEYKSFDNMFNNTTYQWCKTRADSRINIVKTRTIQLSNYYDSLKYIKKIKH